MQLVTSKKSDMCYCPGCTHGMLLEKLGAAIEASGYGPETTCIVSDIGCVGTADRYFASHTFHGLHGRSITYAEGIKRIRPDLQVVVLIGDGGCGIGTAHLVHAARRGVGIKVIVFNNFNFGMTGGQHSPTTPPNSFTPTTPFGAREHPFDICQTVIANGAGHVGRYDSYQKDLPDRLVAALKYPGFALLDLWEMCVAYFVPGNKLTRPRLSEYAESLAMPFGLLHETPPVDFCSPPAAIPPTERKPLPEASPLPWAGRRTLCVAGSAGQRIRSAVGVIGEICTATGLHAAQQDDFPITVRKGHSISYLLVSDEPIDYAGTEDLSLVLLLSEDGIARLGSLDGLPAACTVFAHNQLETPAAAANHLQFDAALLERQVGRTNLALASLASALVQAEWFTAEDILGAADEAVGGKYRDDNLAAIRAGVATVRPGNADSAG